MDLSMPLVDGALLATALAAFSLSVHVAFQLVARWRGRRRPAGADLPLPAISVLKPLKGADPGLYENLVAFVEQDYPGFEIVLAIADAMDDAVAVARQVQRDYPDAPLRIVTGAPDLGFNRKVSNLAHAARHARHDALLVSDADVRPPRDYLRAMGRCLASGADLVHNVIAPGGEQSLGAALDNAQVAGFIAASVGTGAVFGQPLVIGKSMLFHRATLERLGGFHAYKDVLAEDYLIGRAFVEAGLTVELCAMPAFVHNPDRSLRAFFARHMRWLQMRRMVSPFVFACEPLLHPSPWLALLAFERPWVAGLGLSLQLLVEGLMIRHARGSAPRWWQLAALPLKDLGLLAAWVMAMVRTTVEWRGHRMRIGSGTRLTARPTARRWPLSSL
ncbi:MAG: glycosyltransferase [Myxococcales bacterium]|nr:glycosyltransferase [Myxococcales bacterium]